ncbi:MAG: carboxyl transferase domain-containing protein, partial [Solirubrobacteraceae bacterium]
GWRFSSVPFDFTSFLQSPDGCAAIPRVTAALGPSYGDAALHAAMGDFVVMQKDAAIALSGPPVIKAAIGEDVTGTELGGPKIAAGINGAASKVVDTEDEAFAQIKRFLSYLPSSAALPAPVAEPVAPAKPVEDLGKVIPKSRRRGYDMNRLIEILVDGESFFPWCEEYGKSLITGLARIDGNAVGLIASQPMHLAGALDVPALRKEAQFIDLCDRFNLPLVFLQDVPGLMIGTHAEQNGILASYDGVVARLARAKVPKIAVIIRKAFGGGHIAMGGRPIDPDLLVAWPSAEMGFMEPSTGVRTVHRRKLEALLEAEGQEAHDEHLAGLVAEWATESQPWEAAANIILDDIIEPAQTREIISTAIDFAWGTRPRVSPHGA